MQYIKRDKLQELADFMDSLLQEIENTKINLEVDSLFYELKIDRYDDNNKQQQQN